MTKITAEHLARSAYVYIRQSTPRGTKEQGAARCTVPSRGCRIREGRA
jgi:hypothetical protein